MRGHGFAVTIGAAGLAMVMMVMSFAALIGGGATSGGMVAAESGDCQKTTRTEATPGASDDYVALAESIAKDDSHGYNLGSAGPTDFDCSGLVWYVLHEKGYKVGDTRFSTANEGAVLKGAGFGEHDFKKDGLKRGDILVSSSHTEIWDGDGKVVTADHNERGEGTGGKPGDQTGEEITIRAYANEGMSKYYRLEKDAPAESATTTTTTGSAATTKFGINDVDDVINTLAGHGSGYDMHGLKFDSKMIAGMLGNFWKESGYKYAISQGNAHDDASNDDVRSIDIGFGLAQWTYVNRRQGLADLADKSGKSWRDGHVQMQFLFNELSGGYKGAYEAMKKAPDASEAAYQFHRIYESSSDSRAAIQTRMDTAADWEKKLAGLSTTTTSETSATGCVAKTSSSSDSANVGSVGGAPTKDGDFSWMCSGNQKICSATDAGVFYPHLEYGHQCVWYAWNRLAMIHGNDGWSYVRGNGGEIAGNLKGQPGWTVDGNPKAGDGISGSGSPFSGGGAYGHVAVVEEVKTDPSGWRIRISEGNRDGSASFDSYGSRWLTKAQLSGTTCQFFRNSAWK